MLVNPTKLKVFLINMQNYVEFTNELVFEKSGVSKSTAYKIYDILLSKNVIKKVVYIKDNRLKIKYNNNRLKMKKLITELNRGVKN